MTRRAGYIGFFMSLALIFSTAVSAIVVIRTMSTWAAAISLVTAGSTLALLYLMLRIVQSAEESFAGAATVAAAAVVIQWIVSSAYLVLNVSRLYPGSAIRDLLTNDQYQFLMDTVHSAALLIVCLEIRGMRRIPPWMHAAQWIAWEVGVVGFALFWGSILVAQVRKSPGRQLATG